MSTPSPELVAGLKSGPHWRFVLRPVAYSARRVSSLRQLADLARTHSVYLRGWDFPHIGRDDEIENGADFFGSWNDAFGIREYWRLYQSLQFIHLTDVREAIEGDRWYESYDPRNRLDRYANDVTLPPSFVAFVNLVYTVTERFEFAGRLAATGLYDGLWYTSLSINNIQSFLLLSNPQRPLRRHLQCDIPSIHFERTVANSEVASSNRDIAIECCQHIFERFGWHDPSLQVLQSVQADLYSYRR